jgi:hypothetical protein
MDPDVPLVASETELTPVFEVTLNLTDPDLPL